MKNFYCLLFFFLFRQIVFSQNEKSFNINFIPVFKDSLVHLNMNCGDVDKNEDIMFSKLKFYISNISFFREGKLVYKDKQSAHLMDAENKMIITINDFPAPLNFDSMEFGLGIDSATNTKGALDGDLDPTQGMYWTWQSGYINFKLEGKSNKIPSEDGEFIYHLGGYANEKNAYKKLRFSLCPNENKIDISIDLKKYMDNMIVASNAKIMSPGNLAVQLSDFISCCFIKK